MKTINKIILSGIAIIVIALTIAACSSTKKTYSQITDNTTEFTMEKSELSFGAKYVIDVIFHHLRLRITILIGEP